MAVLKSARPKAPPAFVYSDTYLVSRSIPQQDDGQAESWNPLALPERDHGHKFRDRWIPVPQHCVHASDARGRQRAPFGEWGNTDEGHHIPIAFVRYLAAHSPTERAGLQTDGIARQIMCGGELAYRGWNPSIGLAVGDR
jgi:hypothetical protein